MPATLKADLSTPVFAHVLLLMLFTLFQLRASPLGTRPTLTLLASCHSCTTRTSRLCVLSLRQAYGYYDDIIKVLDFYIGLVPSETKAAAEKLVPAKRAALPKFLFKEDSALMKEKVAIS